jgi:hypothetical protein
MNHQNQTRTNGIWGHVRYTRLWCQRQHQRRLRALRASLEVLCWDASCLVDVLQVETFLRVFGGATTTASTPFSSWGRRFGGHGPSPLVVLWRPGCWEFGWQISWKLSLLFLFRSGCFFFLLMYLGARFESKRSVVIVGRIYPLVDIEAGSISLI